MYDELVKRLRAHNGWALNETLDEAADAIEELNKQREYWELEASAQETDKNYLIDENRKLVEAWHNALDLRNRWIPVTERKPKTDDIVIVAIHDDSGDTPYDVTNVGFYLDVFPLGIWVVEDERCNYVTHWMPLPEPPKEE